MRGGGAKERLDGCAIERLTLHQFRHKRLELRAARHEDRLGAFVQRIHDAPHFGVDFLGRLIAVVALFESRPESEEPAFLDAPVNEIAELLGYETASYQEILS